MTRHALKPGAHPFRTRLLDKLRHVAQRVYELSLARSLLSSSGISQITLSPQPAPSTG
jgi:hypothetical protein